MKPQALIFGSIGTLVETSEIQREAFNEAFREAGLDWIWSRADYREMLHRSGGRQRIEAYANGRGASVDADALHARKTAIFDERIRGEGLRLRAGVGEVIAWARANGVKLGFATTTSRDNVEAVFDALAKGERGAPDRTTFDFVGDASMVERPKPEPQIYEVALSRLGVDAAACVAIEDTGVSLAAPISAGIPTVAFPGANAMGDDFRDAGAVVDELDVSIIESVLNGTAPKL